MPAQTVQIEIHASAGAVWRALVDVASWPQWTRSVTGVQRLDDGPLRLGSRTRLKQPRMMPIVWEVTAFEPDREFTWVGRSPGVTTTARHLLEARPGATLLTLAIEHHGPLAGPVRRLTGKRTRTYLNLEANGMKASSESRAEAR